MNTQLSRQERIDRILAAYEVAQPSQQRAASSLLLKSVMSGLLALAAARAKAPALDVDVIDGECSVGGEA